MAAKRLAITDLADLKALLKRYGVDTSTWGVVGPTKSVERLYKEISGKESEIFLVGGVLERRVRRAQTLILYEDSGGQIHKLCERQVYATDGSESFGSADWSVSEKRHKGESARAAASRCLKEELGITGIKRSAFQLLDQKRETYASSAKSYPTLSSRAACVVFLWPMSNRFFKSEYEERQKYKTNYFTWAPYTGTIP